MIQRLRYLYARRYLLYLVLPFVAATLPLFPFLAPDDVTLEKALENQAASTELYLKYQNHEGDYWIFYDREGSLLLLRYRLDRWDYAREDLRDALRQGITYRVQMKILKRVADGEVPKGIIGYGVPRVVSERKIRKIRDLYAAEFVSIDEAALRDLRY